MRLLRAVRPALLLLIAAFLVFAPPYLLRGLSQDYVHAVFEPEPITWRGVLKVWHIVEFRTYQGSVTSHLSARVEAFSKSHPGVFFEVTGMTAEEFAERYARGERPDVYSFPCGLLYREQLQALPEAPEALSTLRPGLSAATADGAVYAVPYLMSGYFLLMNTQRPFLAGARPPAAPEEADLQAALDAGELAIPAVQAALLGLTGAPGETADFSAGKLAYAVADARALGDLQRATGGNVLLSALPVTGYTEQVQYLAAAAETDETRCAIVLELADFLLSGDEQARLASLGAFPVVTEAQTAYAEHLLTDWQAACGDIAAPDPFLYQRHREALEADALRALAGEAGGADAFSERFQVVLNR